MQIEVVTQADDELYDAFQRLIPQLSNNHPPPSPAELNAIVQNSSSTIFVARTDQGEIVGTLTLTLYRVPSGLLSVIDDVVVDGSARGQGVGEALMNKGIKTAREKGAKNISLTSNPMREAANKLYLRMGFVKRETNAYQLKF